MQTSTARRVLLPSATALITLALLATTSLGQVIRIPARAASPPAAGGCCMAQGAGAGHGGGGCGQMARGAGGKGGCQGGAHASGGKGGCGGNHALMQTAWSLLDTHTSIQRRVEDIPGGVRTVTTSDDAKVAAMIQQHAREMHGLLEGGGRIRNWDPLFAAIFDQAEHIDLEIEPIENGVVVRETSEREDVVRLIRAHARKVDEWVDRGAETYPHPTPLPQD